MSRKVPLLLVPLVILSGVSYFIGQTQATPKPFTLQTSSEREKYPLLASRIFLDNPNDPLVNFSVLRTRLEEHVNDKQITGSIYFEYIPTGTSVRIGAESQLVAASLIKVPAAMALYRASERGAVNLDSNIALKEEWLDKAFGELYKKGAGYELTLREAVEIMLEKSDNTALRAVAANIPGSIDQDDNPFSSLDVDYSQNTDLSLSVSARSYASILKCLYYSCYLTKDNSQELLDYLNKTDFDTRLRGGISDKSIPVAHKIGNYTQDTQSDCGIVYIPKRHYILCVMLKAADTPEGDKKIADISKIVYDYMDSLPD